MGLDKKKKSGKKKEKNSSIALNEFYKDKSFQILKLAVEELKEKYDISSKEIFDLIETKESSLEDLPVSIFGIRKLSALEAICKYLKENLKLSYHDIALLLNRNDRTIWTTYFNAKKKKSERLIVKEIKIFIPINIFKKRKLSVLEALVSYLKEEYNLNYNQISILLNRDQRNIWTVYNRAKKKKSKNG